VGSSLALEALAPVSASCAQELLDEAELERLGAMTPDVWESPLPHKPRPIQR
jgi:hypothetical protein